MGGTTESRPITRHGIAATTSISARVREDKFEPLIVDIAIITAGDTITVVVADFNNKQLKSLYKNKGKNSYRVLVLDTNPFCMSPISETTLAVTMPWSDKICFVNVTPDLRLLKLFETDKSYYGIAKIDDDFLAVSTTCETSNSVDIIGHSGEIFKTISTIELGGDLFIDPWYLTVSPSGEILVSDCQDGSLSCFDQSGHRKWRYCLKYPAGVVCNHEGGVLVADLEGNCIFKLDDTGRNVEVIDVGVVLERPRCLAIGDNGRSLFIATESGDILGVN